MKRKNPRGRSDPVRLFILICFLMILFFQIDLLNELGVADGVLYISLILLTLGLPERRSGIYLAIPCSLLTILGYFASPEGGEYWKVVANRFLALYAIWLTAVLSWRGYWRRKGSRPSSISRPLILKLKN